MKGLSYNRPDCVTVTFTSVPMVFLGSTVQNMLPVVQDIDEISMSNHSIEHLDMPYSDCPSQESRSISEGTGQMMADFEAEWEEGAAKEEDFIVAGEVAEGVAESVANDVAEGEGLLSKEGELSSDGDILNSDSENLSGSQPDQVSHDKSCDKSCDTEHSGGDQGIANAAVGQGSEVKVQKESSGDVEEGEVSDSSEEVGVATSSQEASHMTVMYLFTGYVCI